jgi:hypothetical protein
MKETEELLGTKLPEERFALLVNLGKNWNTGVEWVAMCLPSFFQTLHLLPTQLDFLA